MAYKKDYDADFTVLDKLLKVKTTNSDFVLVPAEFNRICEYDASSAIVLARIYYWWRVGDKGTKLRRKVDATGELCIAKSAVAMSLETGLDSRSIEQGAYKKLKKSGIITTYTKERENGHPTTKIVLNEKVLVQRFWIAYKELQLQKAQYKLKINAKILYKVQFYEERIIALQSPKFDPIKDFTRVQNDEKYNPNIDVFDEVDAIDINVIPIDRKKFPRTSTKIFSDKQVPANDTQSIIDHWILKAINNRIKYISSNKDVTAVTEALKYHTLFELKSIISFIWDIWEEPEKNFKCLIDINILNSNWMNAIMLAYEQYKAGKYKSFTKLKCESDGENKPPNQNKVSVGGTLFGEKKNAPNSVISTTESNQSKKRRIPVV